jgi:hypothetical protein
MFKFQVGDELVAYDDDPFIYKVVGVEHNFGVKPLYKLGNSTNTFWTFTYPKHLTERYLRLRHPREEPDDLYI